MIMVSPTKPLAAQLDPRAVGLDLDYRDQDAHDIVDPHRLMERQGLGDVDRARARQDVPTTADPKEALSRPWAIRPR